MPIHREKGPTLKLPIGRSSSMRLAIKRTGAEAKEAPPAPRRGPSKEAPNSDIDTRLKSIVCNRGLLGSDKRAREESADRPGSLIREG